MNFHTVYHITPRHNLLNILNEGYLKSFIGCIYICPTYEDMLKFIIFSERWVIDECVILELHLSSDLPNRWEESLDHNKKFIPADAIIYKHTELPFIKAHVIDFK